MSEGSTDVSDIEAILTGYFDCNTHLKSADDLYMLIVSVLEWLRDVKLSDTYSDDLAKTLLSMSKAVNTMVNSLGNDAFQDVMYPPLPLNKHLFDIYASDLLRPPFYWYGDNIWRVLLSQNVPFAEPKEPTNHLLASTPPCYRRRLPREQLLRLQRMARISTPRPQRSACTRWMH